MNWGWKIENKFGAILDGVARGGSKEMTLEQD